MPAFKQVNCPNCQKIVRWCDEEVFRPFCSKQCQLVDFGAWANEQHRIPVEESGHLAGDNKEED